MSLLRRVSHPGSAAIRRPLGGVKTTTYEVVMKRTLVGKSSAAVPPPPPPASPVSLCTVPAYEDLARDLGLPPPKRFIAGAQQAYFVLGSALLQVPISGQLAHGLRQIGAIKPADGGSNGGAGVGSAGAMAEGTAGTIQSVTSVAQAGLRQLPGFSPQRPVPDAALDPSPFTVNDAPNKANPQPQQPPPTSPSPSAAAASSNGSTAAAEVPPVAATPSVAAATSSAVGSDAQHLQFVSEEFHGLCVAFAQHGWRRGTNLFFIAHPYDHIVDTKIIEVGLIGRQDKNFVAMAGTSPADDASASTATAPASSGEQQNEHSGGKKKETNSTRPAVVIAEDDGSAFTDFYRNVLSEQGLYDETAKLPLPHALYKQRQTALLDKLRLMVKVHMTVVVPPERVCKNFDFFYDRLQDCSNDTEKKNAAFVYSMSRVYPVVAVFDLFWRIVARRPLPLYANALPLKLFGLPENFLQVPFRLRKIMTMEFTPSGSFRIAGLENVAPGTVE